MDVDGHNLVLLPDDRIANGIVSLSERLSAIYPVHFRLDESRRPHVTVFMFRATSHGLTAIREKLASVVEDVGPIALTGKRYGGRFGFLHVAYELTSVLARLRQEFAETVDRDDEYDPHITILRLLDHEASVDPVSAMLPPPDHFSGKATEMAVFEVGEHGTTGREIFRSALP